MGKIRKKERRALEKLWQKGHYWEWFGAVESKNLVNIYQTQWQEAWRLLVKRSFRLPERLQDFWKHIDGMKKFPDFSDFKLLLFLRDFVEGKEVTKEVSALEGLSLPAKAFRDRALSWQDAGTSLKKIKKLLNAFTNHPETTGQKAYKDLALLVGDSSISRPIEILREAIGLVRKLNHKSTITRGPRALRMEELREIDSLVEESYCDLSSSLQQILLYPFIYQINRFFNWLSKKGDMNTVVMVISSLPFLFSITAGEKADGIKDRLMLFDLKSISGGDSSFLLKKIEHAGFEEKVALLGRMRSLAKDDLGALFDVFQSLYRQVLSDIARRKEILSPRERRELAMIMEPVLLRDLDFLMDDSDDPPRVLTRIAEAGCMGQKLSILSLIAAEKDKNAQLKKHAKNILDNLSTLNEENVLWALSHFMPHIGNLKPLIEDYGDKISSISKVADKIMSYAENHLLTASLVGNRYDFLSELADIPVDGSRKGLAILRRELRVYRGYEPFSPILAYLDCFPDNCFTEKGFEQFLTKTYEKTNTFDFLIDQLHGISKRLLEGRKSPAYLLLWHGLCSVLEEQERICILFLEKHLNNMKTMPLKDIERVVTFLFEKDTMPDMYFNTLTRIRNLLTERIKTGDKAAAVLSDRITGFLVESCPAPKKKRKRRT